MRVFCQSALAFCLGFWATVAQSDPLVVFAASSLKGALDEVVATSSYEVRVSYASSATLARQIAQGAPADVFISANQTWMDWAEEQGAVTPESRIDLLTNRLVLVSGDAAHEAIVLKGDTVLNPGIIAMGQVNAVPAGIYGKAALDRLGLWQAWAPHVAETQSVRHALALAALGEAAYGVVYLTDALADPQTHVVAEFAADLHPEIRYPAALTTQSSHPDGLPFLESLAKPEAGAVFRRHGFGLADATPKR